MISHLDYYKNPDVRERILEFCSNEKKITAEYIVGFGEAYLFDKDKKTFKSHRKDELELLLDKGVDIFRSVWDKENILFILDIEYFNLDYPGTIYLYPQEIFRTIEPLYNFIKKLYDDYGIDYITILTGKGYHFISQMSINSEEHKKLEEIAKIEDSLMGKYHYLAKYSRRERKVNEKEAKGWEASGRLLEFLMNRIILESAYKDFTIFMSDISSKNKGFGREGISIDLTMYGDPLFMRDIRIPFSTHQKHKVYRDKVGHHIADSVPIRISLPRRSYNKKGEIIELEIETLLEWRQHYRNSSEYAKEVITRIPNSENGWINVLEDYKNSLLYLFHKYFDKEEHDNWYDWTESYDRIDISTLPACVSEVLKNPNPELLKPTNLQNLVRVLMGCNWHPKHIAGLIRSKYERDYSWSVDWLKYDAATRANFWVRVYSGQIIMRSDSLIDFNCISQKEKGFCFKPFCGYNLEQNKRLLEKRIEKIIKEII